MNLSVRAISVITLIAGVLLFGAPLFAQDDGLNWHTSYPEAVQEAKRTGKPIFLEFRCEP